MRHLSLAGAVMIALANQGYWFGGETNEATVAWPIIENTPEATLHWRLSFANTVIDRGSQSMPQDAARKRFTIELPEARVRTKMSLAWWLSHPDKDKALARGKRTLHVFPDNLLKPIVDRYMDRRLAVLESGDNLYKALSQAGFDPDRVDSLRAIGMQPPDVLLIGPKALDSDPSAALRALARNGVQIMVFRQTKMTTLAGFALTKRMPPRRFAWDTHHPLLSQLQREDWRSWRTALNTEAVLSSLKLPADAPALAIAGWPRKVASKKPTPRSAVALTQTIGKGRLVLWQLPLGSWQDDPRSQALLAGALHYLLTDPRPTPAPDDRPDTKGTLRSKLDALPTPATQPTRKDTP